MASRALACGASLPVFPGAVAYPPLNNPDLQAFIRACVRSVWALELLVLLKREPVRAWTAEGLVHEMRASTAVVADVLECFEQTGLVRQEPPGSWTYAPAAPALAQLADQLETAYRERPARVIKAILSSPNDKLQSFADAFRFKGDPK